MIALKSVFFTAFLLRKFAITVASPEALVLIWKNKHCFFGIRHLLSGFEREILVFFRGLAYEQVAAKPKKPGKACGYALRRAAYLR